MDKGLSYARQSGLLFVERADSDTWAVMVGGGNHNSTNVDLELEFSKYVSVRRSVQYF